MSHLEPQIVYGRWLNIDGPSGTECIGPDLVYNIKLGGFRRAKRERYMRCAEYAQALFARAKDFCENQSYYTCAFRWGYGARLSAPGYLDATDWTIFDTEAKAVEYLAGLEEDSDC